MLGDAVNQFTEMLVELIEPLSVEQKEQFFGGFLSLVESIKADFGGEANIGDPLAPFIDQVISRFSVDMEPTEQEESDELGEVQDIDDQIRFYRAVATNEKIGWKSLAY